MDHHAWAPIELLHCVGTLQQDHTTLQMPRYTSKNIRSNWSEESLFRAIESVQNENSLRKAAEQFKVPRTTLSRRLSSP